MLVGNNRLHHEVQPEHPKKVCHFLQVDLPITPLVSVICLQQCDLDLVSKPIDFAENFAPGLRSLDGGTLIHRQHGFKQDIAKEQEGSRSLRGRRARPMPPTAL